MHELAELTVLAKLFKLLSIDCVIDIGANRGQYATNLRTKVGFRGEIISIEPYSDAYNELEKASRGDSNWTALNLAISNTNKTQTLNIMHSDQMSSFQEPTSNESPLLEKYNEIIKTEDVKCITLDELLERANEKTAAKRIFLKLDTQGHDIKICEPSKNLGKLCGLQSEISFKRLYKNTPKYYESIDFFQSNGFELTSIVPNNRGHFPWLLEMDIIMFNPEMAKKF